MSLLIRNGQKNLSKGMIIALVICVLLTGLAMAQKSLAQDFRDVFQLLPSDDPGILMEPGAVYEFDKGMGLNLQERSSGEKTDIPVLESVLHDLENRYALMMKIIGLQGELIDFASVDAPVAYRFRIPQDTCLEVLEERFCNAMAASFGSDDLVLLPEISKSADSDIKSD